MKRRAPNSHSKDVCVDDGMRGFLMVRHLVQYSRSRRWSLIERQRPAFIGHRGVPAPEELANGIPLIETSGRHPNIPTIAQDGADIEINVEISRPAKRTIRFAGLDDNEESIVHNGENATKKARPRIRFEE
jgi:hypothetical protein